jgi:hypothetical protein
MSEFILHCRNKISGYKISNVFIVICVVVYVEHATNTKNNILLDSNIILPYAGVRLLRHCHRRWDDSTTC